MCPPFHGLDFIWEGRRLTEAEVGSDTVSYTYNIDGIRTSKTVGTETTEYFLEGSTVIAQKTGNNVLWFLYDADGQRIGFTYNDTPYLYVYNATGDVVGIVDDTLTMVVEYTYSPWGEILSTTGDKADTIGVINPFRYRGYYYDEETGLYYLNARYYDPETGRFISMDREISGIGDSIQGYNSFSYCFNDPINMIDSTGSWPQWIEGGINWVDNNIVQPVKKFIDDIVEDINNYDKYNQSETKVLNSNYFSSYKGVPVFRIEGNRSGSFGAIFLTRETNNRTNPEDVVRHEYGHTKQLEQLGVTKYIFCIALPSWQEWGTGNYYSKPWELTADIYGGVQSRTHTQAEIDAGFDYLETSDRIGLFAWGLIQ